MANDAVAMLKSSQVEESQGKRVVVAMRGARRKKTRQEGFAGRHEAGGSFCGLCLAGEAVVHKQAAGAQGLQRRWVWVSRKKRPGGPCKSGERAGRTGLEASSML